MPTKCVLHVQLQLKRQRRRIEEKETRERYYIQQRLNEYIMLLLDNADQLLDSVVRYSNEYY